MKLLFVCHGNICRSPMAEFVFRELVREKGLEDRISAASAATSTDAIGSPVHHGTRQKLAQYGISVEGKRAVQLKKSDYESYDFIIGMDRMNMHNMQRLFGGDPERKLSLLLDFAGREGEEIADPWYTGNFDETYDDVLEGCTALLERLAD